MKPVFPFFVISLFILFHFLAVTLSAVGVSSPAHYEYQIFRSLMPMQDGTLLSATLWVPKPIPIAREEKFPVLLEFLPYRKDDRFYQRDFPICDYFVRNGYIVAKVDIRGTGASRGGIPDREYSDIEIADAVEVIRQLALLPQSNGQVGMWGLSWSGFNSIQVAMESPPALKAILAIHASDDLYHDDIHYIDGALHIDEYALTVEGENILPAWPNYALDEKYLRHRLRRTPWFLTYLKNQRDGEFWRKRSFRYHPQKLKIPTYLIGGLLDGYRDTPIRMMEQLTTSDVPVKVEIGPWNHGFPNNGTPGPHYEWRATAVRWWDHWLKDRDTGILREPALTLFVREGNPPDMDLKTLPGHWRNEEWQIQRTIWKRFTPSENGTLREEKRAGGSRREKSPRIHSLHYRPSSGKDVGTWWGELTPDMRNLDRDGLVYDSAPLTEKMEIIGFPHVSLQVSADAKLAHWIVRLEDRFPDGRVSLVTGGLINGAHRHSTLRPQYLVPGEKYSLDFPLHFTTWTFQPGHRIRLAVTNAQFPMIWPTPHPMTTELTVDSPHTSLRLPVIPFEERPIPSLPSPEKRAEPPNALTFEESWPMVYLGFEKSLNPLGTKIDWRGKERFDVGKTTYALQEKMEFFVNEEQPANASFLGEAKHRILQKGGRTVDIHLQISLKSDPTHFILTLERGAFEDGKEVGSYRWDEKIPREFQ